MSGSVALPAIALNDAERADIRRFCGYPAYGSGATGFIGWRFFQAYGTLEYRLTNLAPAEFQVVRQFLAQLYALETAIPGAGATMGTAKAAVWTRNTNEVRDRTALLNGWRRQLCAVIGVPPGDGLGTGGVRLVV